MASTRSWSWLLCALVVMSSLAACGGSEAADVPADVESVIASFDEATETNNPELMESIITDDFSYAYTFYAVGRTQIFDEVDLSRTDLLFNTTHSTGWVISQVGTPASVGGGPWHVSVPEKWILHGVGWEGIATYTVVDDGGAKLIAEVFFVGTGTANSQ